MQYREKIVERLIRHGFLVKEHQIQTINEVLEAYVFGHRYVALCAPTGSGKSVIGIIVSDILAEIYNSKLASFILMQNNTLVDQYEKMCENIDDVLVLKGAENYECSALQRDATMCTYAHFKKLNKNDIINRHCVNCNYRHTRDAMNEARFVISNYSYFFIANLYGGFLAKRLLTIYDEAQEMNDVFCNTYAVHLNRKRLDIIEDEIKEALEHEESDHYRNILQEILNKTRAINFKAVIRETYWEFLEKELDPMYKLIMQYFEEKSQAALEREDFVRYTHFKKLMRKYFNLHCKIDDLFKYKYEHVFDEGEGEEFTVKPIFMDGLFQFIQNSELHLFMSATINPYYISKTMDIDEKDIKFIVARTVFLRENKKVAFLNTHYLNYNNAKDPKTLTQLAQVCETIIAKHKDEKGIILVPSFFLGNQIVSKLESKLKDTKIFKQEPKQKLIEVLKKFKAYKGAALLVSPSLYVGVDLPDEDSRFQIMIKCPFFSLGDKRIKYILDNHPHLYKVLTMFRIIQGMGRSTRSENDWSITYCLDGNIEKIFNIAEKELQEQFLVLK